MSTYSRVKKSIAGEGKYRHGEADSHYSLQKVLIKGTTKNSLSQCQNFRNSFTLSELQQVETPYTFFHPKYGTFETPLHVSFRWTRRKLLPTRVPSQYFLGTRVHLILCWIFSGSYCIAAQRANNTTIQRCRPCFFSFHAVQVLRRSFECVVSKPRFLPFS